MLKTPVEKNEFMCCCNDEGEVRCGEVRARAMEIVVDGFPLEGDLDFVNRMMYRLVFEGVMEINADQWAAVGMTPYETPGKIKESSSFQCDSIVDGMAAAVVYYFGEDHG